MANSEIYHTDSRQHANFHQPSMNMTKYQKGVYYLGVKVFNMFPSDKKKESDNTKKFRLTVQKLFLLFLFENSCPVPDSTVMFSPSVYFLFLPGGSSL